MRGKFFGYQRGEPCEKCGSPRVIADCDDTAVSFPGKLEALEATCSFKGFHRKGDDKWYAGDHVSPGSKSRPGRVSTSSKPEPLLMELHPIPPTQAPLAYEAGAELMCHHKDTNHWGMVRGFTPEGLLWEPDGQESRTDDPAGFKFFIPCEPFII